MKVKLATCNGVCGDYDEVICNLNKEQLGEIEKELNWELPYIGEYKTIKGETIASSEIISILKVGRG